MIDIIEGIEPDVHNYIAYEMLNPDGSAHPAKRWLLNICGRSEVIDVEKSNVVQLGTGMFADVTAGGRRPLIVVKADCAAQRAIWHEWRYHSSHRFIVSDRFWSALQAGNIRGWSPKFGTYPDHIEEA
ncbi:hypothetical protein RN629_09955 [Sphingomonadaceae bacterium jetA1]